MTDAFQGAPIKRIVLCPGDALFNQGKIVIKQFLGLRTGSDRLSAIQRRHDNLCGHQRACSILVVYWMEVIGWILSMVP
jgi:hypothetical protein